MSGGMPSAKPQGLKEDGVKEGSVRQSGIAERELRDE